MGHPRYITLLAVVCSLFMLSCKKKELSKPTDVNFAFSIDEQTTSSTKDYLSFDKGYSLVKKIEINGIRTQGEDYIETKIFGNPKQMFFNATNNPSILFKVSQGIYEDIEIKLHLTAYDSTPRLSVDGIYRDRKLDDQNFPQFYPIHVDFSFNEILTLKASRDGSGENIVLNKEEAEESEIIFDPNYWFETVTRDLIEAASRDMYNGKETIVISAYSNVEIYNLLINRIEESTSAIFKKS